jgi:NADPH-dependent 2,4-dienoyl-CoA reductase/sulfur reductase-like enzyme
MANGHVKYLLLGGGSAAASAAEAIRRHDPVGDILLVSTESLRPYQRPPLARGYLRRELRLDELFVHPSDWYTKLHVTLRTGVRALALDANKRAVTLSDSSEVLYDRLLIATGASARHLDIPGDRVGAVIPGVMHLRTIEDVDRIHHAADVALASGRGRVAVIGCTLMAAEVAASLRLRKNNPVPTAPNGLPIPGAVARPLEVTLVCPRPQLFAGLAGDFVSRAGTRALEQLGVTVLLNHPVTSLEGDGRVQRVVIGGGQGPVPCDFAIVAEGWTPSKDLLRGTAVAAEKAILTDVRGQTNLPDIYAAGECAAMFDPVFGKHRLLDHWDVTVSRGLTVGANMAGADEPWAGVTVHRAEIGSTRLVVMGEPRFAERRLIRDLGEQGQAELALDREGRVCAAALVNYRPPENAIDALIRSKTSVQGREEDLRDPTKQL